MSDLQPGPIGKVQFKLSFIKSVPAIEGCYALTSFNGEALYIGLATNLKLRFEQHLDNTEKTSTTVNGKAIWFYYSPFDSKDLRKIERTWINQYVAVHGNLPILNKVSSPI